MPISNAFTDTQWLVYLIILFMMNTLEAYDIPDDFPKHEHEQKSHAKKVIQHLSWVYFIDEAIFVYF